MPTFHRYRATIFSVSLALLLSSVGLPVIVVACEMGTMVAVRGCGVLSRRGAPSDMSITRIPCRAHYRYIEGNATVYVPAKRAPDHLPLQLSGIVPQVSYETKPASTFTCCPSESPPLPQDISLLTSVLLI